MEKSKDKGSLFLVVIVAIVALVGIILVITGMNTSVTKSDADAEKMNLAGEASRINKDNGDIESRSGEIFLKENTITNSIKGFTPINGCPYEITSPGDYSVDVNLENCGQYAIKINSVVVGDVNIYCDPAKTIIGNVGGSRLGAGILVDNVLSEISIYNCKIMGFQNGILLTNVRPKVINVQSSTISNCEVAAVHWVASIPPPSGLTPINNFPPNSGAGMGFPTVTIPTIKAQYMANSKPILELHNCHLIGNGNGKGVLLNSYFYEGISIVNTEIHEFDHGISVLSGRGTLISVYDGSEVYNNDKGVIMSRNTNLPQDIENFEIPAVINIKSSQFHHNVDGVEFSSSGTEPMFLTVNIGPGSIFEHNDKAVTGSGLVRTHDTAEFKYNTYGLKIYDDGTLHVNGGTFEHNDYSIHLTGSLTDPQILGGYFRDNNKDDIYVDIQPETPVLLKNADICYLHNDDFKNLMIYGEPGDIHGNIVGYDSGEPISACTIHPENGYGNMQLSCSACAGSECLDDTDCPTTCVDSDTRMFQECLNGYCSDDYQFDCPPGDQPFCFEGQCVECLNDNTCGSTSFCDGDVFKTPYCSQTNTCEVSSQNCASEGKYCHQSDGCVECLTNNQCGGGYCNGDSFIMLTCNSVYQCVESQPEDCGGFGCDAPNGCVCHDSDDGLNYEIQGTTIQGDINYVDNCDIRYGELLLEYYCNDDGILSFESVFCDDFGQVCSQGRCDELGGIPLDPNIASEIDDTNPVI